jgi:hypothetical protein
VEDFCCNQPGIVVTFFLTPNLKRRMKMPRIDKGLKELAFKMSEEGKTQGDFRGDGH